MIKSVHDIIQSDRRMNVENIAHSFNIFVGVAHEIIYKYLSYSKATGFSKCLLKNTSRKEWNSLSSASSSLSSSDNSKPHTIANTVETIKQFGWDICFPTPLTAQTLPLPIPTCLGHSKSLPEEQSLPVMRR